MFYRCTASAAQRAEDRPVATPIEVDHGETLVTSPHASNGTARKRKHETDGEDDTHPGKRSRAQFAHRTVPLPRTYTYVWRRPIVLPTPVDDSSGFLTSSLLKQTLALPARLPRRTSTNHGLAHAALRSTSSRNHASLGVALYPCPISRRHQPPPSHASTDLSTPLAKHPPFLPDVTGFAVDIECNVAAISYFTPLQLAICFSSPSSRSLLDFFPSHGTPSRSPPPVLISSRPPSLGIQMLSPNSPLGFALATDEPPPNSLPDVVDLTSEDIDDAANAILFASHPPSPSFASAFPSTSIVEDDNVPKRGVKTEFWTSEIPAPPQIRQYPPIFLSRASERPRDPDETASTAMRTVDQHHANTADTTAQARPPDSAPTNCDRRTRKRPHDSDELVPEDTHAQPRQVRSRRIARQTDHLITNEQSPNTLAKRRAVDIFLDNYDAATTVQEPTPVKEDHAYDAVLRHIDYRARINTGNIAHRPSQPFHHTVIQYATMSHDGTQPRQIRTSRRLLKRVTTKLFEDE
ncbi:hypothetical protein EDB85DRAFT_1887820 [Lactarius pseudohatsudake]|nr:hypothetical protein EDB85DRAFT_1887820 [Lactarius pseudohatsudake]